MIQFLAEIKKFGEMGEKTGWTFVEIPQAIAQQLKPGNKKSFRVCGLLDQFPIRQVALMPMGGGDFILVLNAEMRKVIRKEKGMLLSLALEEDHSPFENSPDLVACLEEDPEAKSRFFSLAPSHQRYFSNWIEQAKTLDTKTRRILLTIRAVQKGWDYGQMIREDKKRRVDSRH